LIDTNFSRGKTVASGVYMLNMIQGEFASARSIQLLK